MMPGQDDKTGAKAEVERLSQLSTVELAVAIMPAFGTDGLQPEKLWWGARGIEVLQISDWLIRRHAKGDRSRPRHARASFARGRWSDRKRSSMGARWRARCDVAIDCPRRESPCRGDCKGASKQAGRRRGAIVWRGTRCGWRMSISCMSLSNQALPPSHLFLRGSHRVSERHTDRWIVSTCGRADRWSCWAPLGVDVRPTRHPSRAGTETRWRGHRIRTIQHHHLEPR